MRNEGRYGGDVGARPRPSIKPRFVETHPGRGGPCVGSLFRCYSQPYSPLAILTALTLRALFRLGLRQTEGLIASIPRLLGLELRVPDHTTLSRRAEGLPVPRPRPGPLHLLVDSTGLRLSGPGEWLIE